jgi:hypothetical protein
VRGGRVLGGGGGGGGGGGVADGGRGAQTSFRTCSIGVEICTNVIRSVFCVNGTLNELNEVPWLWDDSQFCFLTSFVLCLSRSSHGC